jgi:hypothetical protein
MLRKLKSLGWRDVALHSLGVPTRGDTSSLTSRMQYTDRVKLALLGLPA